MVDVYLFLGPHDNEADFKALESAIKPFIPELTKKEKLISIIEYGGPPFFPSYIMPYEIAFSDEKLKKYFTEHKKVIQEELEYFKKHKKGLPNVKSQPFFYLMLNLILDLKSDLILEDVTYEKYRFYVRYYHNFWRKIYSDALSNAMRSFLIKKQNPELPNIKNKEDDALNPSFCLRDCLILEQVHSLSLKNSKATFLIIRGDRHKDLVPMFAFKGFKVLPYFY